jgi:phosphoglycolate phosphatase-like HAD superfamily hydrolase
VGIDLDGTLINTEVEVSRITADLATRHGASITTEQVMRRYAGQSSTGKFESLFNDQGIPVNKDQITQLGAEHELRKRELYDRPNLPVITGAMNALKAFRFLGIKVGVITTNARARAEAGLKKTGMAEYVDGGIWTADMGYAAKLAPDTLIAFMQQYNASPDKTVYIGDNLTDAKTGKAAGVARTVILLDEMFGTGHEAEVKKEELKHAGATHVVRTFSGVLYASLGKRAAALRSNKPQSAPSAP